MTTAAPTSEIILGEVFVGRQPIVDTRQDPIAYDILYRSSEHLEKDPQDRDHATKLAVDHAVNCVSLFDHIPDKKIFVRISANLLIEQFYQFLPPNQTVLHLTDVCNPTQELIDACSEATDEGYDLAIDSNTFEPHHAPILPEIFWFIVDFQNTDADKQKELIETLLIPDRKFVAQDVRTHEELEYAKSIGYHYFHGPFLAKPCLAKSNELTPAKQNMISFIHELTKPQIDFDALEPIIKRDAALSVKLLRLLNNASIGLTRKIESIKHAMLLLGEEPLRKWGSLVSIACLGEDKSSELTRISLNRANFCETIADKLNLTERKLDLYMLGLLSTLDALVDQSMQDVLNYLPIPEDVRQTLTGETTEFSHIYNLMLALEKGDFNTVQELAESETFPPLDAAALWTHALQATDELLDA